MNTMKKLIALLLVLVLAVSCFPLSAIEVFATESETEVLLTDEPPDPSTLEESSDTTTKPLEPEETLPTEEPEIPTEEATEPTEPDNRVPMFSTSPDPRGGSSGSETGDAGSGGNEAGEGNSNMVAAGVTMQVVYYRYDQCYNRYNSHGSVINTLKTGNAIPWNSTGKDTGDNATTVFDTYTISTNTFIIKGGYDAWPYVYHFPTENLKDNKCNFTWTGWQNFWFNYDNPGGKASTYPRIVRNEENGSLAIERYIRRIILGNDYGEWDKLDVAKGETVETDTSLFAKTLKYLGTPDQAIQNYLDAYFGKLSVTQDGDVLIPTIIWSWVGAEDLSGTSRIYTIGDVASKGSSKTDWLKTAYTTAKKCNTGFGNCKWMSTSKDTMICKLMLGGSHYTGHSTSIWTSNGSECLFGTGLVNRIQTEVDSTEEDGSNTFYYLRGYWTPYGSGSGDISITKTNTEGTANLAGAEFTLYRDAACTVPVTAADYSTLSDADAGYVSVSVRKTTSAGLAQWTGLHAGAYFLKETKAPEGYQVNIDATGNVEVTEVAVSNGETAITLTNASNAVPVSLKKSINASASCIDQIKNNPLYSLAGAEYSVSLNGKVVETLKTDANGNAKSSKDYNIGDVLTIKETKAPKGYKLDTKTYTLTVKDADNVLSVSDIPIFDPPFVLTKVDKDTTTPQGDGSFQGAVFKWEFYPNEKWSGTAARTWYFATDSNGRCLYSKDYLSNGYTSDALYASPAGVNQLPLGSLKITEVKNSLGYTVIPNALLCTVVADSSAASGAKHVWTDTSMTLLKQMANGDWGVYEPIDESLFGAVVLEKYDSVTGQQPQGEATFAGAMFQIINSSKNPVMVNGTVYAPGSVVCELITDATGRVQTESIFPVGTYTIKEITPPEGYLLNAAWQKTFSVTGENKNFHYTYDLGTGCPDMVITGKIKIFKQIENAIDNLVASEVGAQFAITNAKGNEVDTIITDKNGIGISHDLPYGIYTVTQVKGKDGTIFAEPWTVTINEHGKMYEYAKNNPLWTASVSIHKKEVGVETPLVATFELCERMADGTIKVLETGTTDAEGNLAFARKIVYTDGICNTSTYFVREKEAPNGYMLDTNEYPVSCTSNEQVISVTVENAPILGKLELRKRSSIGKPMQNVLFLLEYSLDGGTTWNKVTKRNDDSVITPGTCTSAALNADGTMATDGEGNAVYTGLRVYTAEGIPILYRATELKTQNGASLMPGPVWEDDLISESDGEEQYEVILRVVNSPLLELPDTGSTALSWMPIDAAICIGICIFLLFLLHKEKKEV